MHVGTHIFEKEIFYNKNLIPFGMRYGINTLKNKNNHHVAIKVPQEVQENALPRYQESEQGRISHVSDVLTPPSQTPPSAIFTLIAHTSILNIFSHPSLLYFQIRLKSLDSGRYLTAGTYGAPEFGVTVTVVQTADIYLEVYLNVFSSCTLRVGVQLVSQEHNCSFLSGMSCSS